MKVTKSAIVFLAAVYLFLWGVALNGASGLVPLLATPLVLVVLVAGGNWMTSSMGIKRKSPQFKKRSDSE
jgi:NADH:ubiquinone oxidoreductase subunit 3 (subunit A)